MITNAPTINSMGAEEATAKLRLLIDGMLGNKAMLVYGRSICPLP